MPEFVASTTDTIMNGFLSAGSTLITYMIDNWLLVFIGLGIVGMVWGLFSGFVHRFIHF